MQTENKRFRATIATTHPRRNFAVTESTLEFDAPDKIRAIEKVFDECSAWQSVVGVVEIEAPTACAV